MPQGHTVRREPTWVLYQAHTRRARGLLSWAPNGFPSFSVTGRVHYCPASGNRPSSRKEARAFRMALRKLFLHREGWGALLKPGNSNFKQLGAPRWDRNPTPPSASPWASLDL